MSRFSGFSFLLYPALFAIAFVILSIFCTSSTSSSSTPYHPRIVFAGYINNDYDSLPGNTTWPNSCALVNDTVRMYFYSDTFHESNHIRAGDLLRIDLFPGGSDTLIGLKYARIHLARYLETNYSYDVGPSDTLQDQATLSMHGLSLSRNHGGAIDIDRIEVEKKALIIQRGRISGTVQ
jgi:hypothetical protein